MIAKIKFILLIGILLGAFPSKSQDIWKGYEHLFKPARNYVVYKTTSKINIDGKANESSWKDAKWSEYFVDIEGEHKAKPLFETQVKMLWDELNLYIFAELEEPHIWAYYTTNDMVVYHENDFEVFIDPDRDTHNYYEFELNAQNTLFDLFMNKSYRNGGKADIPWDAKGFNSAVHINGTINNHCDIDKSWTVEMAIPFSSLTHNGNFLQPKNGDVWKVNFSRVQWKTEVIDGKYKKKINPETNKAFPEDNWVWSPQGIINMHYPERWSLVQFSSNEVKGKKESFELPIEETLAKYLWLVFYKQQNFILENGVYASALSQLEIPDKGIENVLPFQLSLKVDHQKFSAKLETDTDLVLTIDQSGLFQVWEK